jgi:AcrR family transcriptional regulator
MDWLDETPAVRGRADALDGPPPTVETRFEPSEEFPRMPPELAPHVARPVKRGSKGERTQVRILDAAEDLFAERGFAGTTLRDVARAVDLRIPSLYNHFVSKEALYAAVLERGLRPVLDIMATLAEGVESPRAEDVITRVMEVLGERPKLPRLILHETLSGGERLTEVLRDWIAPVFAQAEEALVRSTAGRRWKAEQVPLIALMLYHEIVGYFSIAPVYRALNGVDLLAPEMLERHTRFLSDLVDALVPDGDGDAKGDDG